MIRIGYHCLHEQFGPRGLLRDVEKAAQTGFDRRSNARRRDHAFYHADKPAALSVCGRLGTAKVTAPSKQQIGSRLGCSAMIALRSARLEGDRV
jgi:hypothetical protein